MNGILLFDNNQNRFVVQQLINGVITDDAPVRELHCRDCLTIRVKADDWRDTRMETDSDDELYGWYFVGVGRAALLIGHSVEIK